MQLIHTVGSHLTLKHEGVDLFRYVYRSQAPAIESPRPYFHPLRTLKGHLVTAFQPEDHLWHHGLSLTSAFLSGNNFWGGRTFVDGDYRQLDNNGHQEVRDWRSLPEGGEITGPVVLNHQVVWVTAGGAELLVEERTLRVQLVAGADYWTLEWESKLTPVGRDALHWGSPTTQGRENAGYGGLFWRGPRDFEGGKILLSEGREGPDVMGQNSPWLAYIGQHDEADQASMLVFVDDAQNPESPTPWFVRNTTPMVCPNFAFAREYVQQPGETLRLSYKLLIGDGAWEREAVEATVRKLGRPTKDL